MVEAFTDARWDAIRAIVEGAAPTHERVAAACGVYVKTISRRATLDGWKTLNFSFQRVRAAHKAMIAVADAARAGDELDPVREEEEPDLTADDGGPEMASIFEGMSLAEKTARIGSILTGRIEKILAGIEAGRAVEPRQVAALNALVQLAEKITTMSQEEKRKEAVRTNEEKIEALARVEARIFELGLWAARHIFAYKFGLSTEQIDEIMPPEDPEDPLAAYNRIGLGYDYWPNGPRRLIIEPCDEPPPRAQLEMRRNWHDWSEWKQEGEWASDPLTPPADPPC